MTNADYTLHAALIGTFSVTLNEQIVADSNGLPQQILARLLLDPAQGHSYRQLAQDMYNDDLDLLRPDERDKRLNSTRKAVQRLRATLGAAGKYLLPDASRNGDKLMLALRGVAFSADLEQFKELAAHCEEEDIACYQAALKLCKGRLLPDFPPHSWVEIARSEMEDQRERLERHYQQTLLRYIDVSIRSGAYQRSLEARRDLCEWMAQLVAIPTFQKSRHFDVVNGKLRELSQQTTEYVCQRVSDSDFAGAISEAAQLIPADAGAHTLPDNVTEALTTTSENALLSRCSMFKRAWSMEAAQGVCKPDGINVAVIIEGLCRSHVIRVMPQEYGTLYHFSSAADQRRWRENLQRQGKMEATLSLYFETICALAEHAASQFDGAEQVAWFNKLEAEHQNIEFILEWVCKEQGRAQTTLHLAERLWRYWDVRGYRTQGRKHLRHLLAMPENKQPSLARAAALNGAAVLAILQEDYVEAEERLEEARTIALNLLAQTNEPSKIAALQDALGGIYNSRGFLAWREDTLDRRTSRSHYRQARYWFRKAGNEAASVWALRGLADYCKEKRQMARAQILYEESRVVAEKTNNKRGLAFALSDLARAAEVDRDWQKARKLFVEAMTHADDIQDRGLFAVSLEALTRIAIAQKRWRRAATLLATAEHLRQHKSLYMWGEEEEGNKATKILLQQELGDAYEAIVEQGRTLAADRANIVGFVMAKDTI